MCLIEPLSNSRGAAHLRYSLELVLVWCRAWGRRGAVCLLWGRVREAGGGGEGGGRGEGGEGVQVLNAVALSR